MSEKKKIVTNSDNELLMPIGGCGSVDEDNGPGAEEIQGFVPTRHELIQIVKYWANVELDLNYFMFFHSTTGSDLLRQTSFAQRRIGRIAKILGEDEVRKAIDGVYTKFEKDLEVFTEFGEDLDKEAWDIFLHRTKAYIGSLSNT